MAIVFAVFFNGYGQLSVDCPCTADAYLASSAPNSNYGSSQTLLVTVSSTEEIDPIFKFDLSQIPSGAIIDYAYMRLTRHTGFTSTPTEGNVRRVSESWSESTVTWNNWANYYVSPSYSFTTGSATFWSFNVLAFVKSWVEDGDPNHGVYLMPSNPNGNAFYFYSREVSTVANRPYLYVEYHFPEADITVTNPSVTPTTVCAGGTIDASCDHNCTGGTDATPNIGYYLSTNTICNTSDTYLYDEPSSICGSDPSDPESQTLTIPAGTSPGTYYLCFIGDLYDEVSESNESNNCAYVQITVQDCSCNAPTGLSSAATGQTTADLDWWTGSGAIGWEVRYKLLTSSTWTTQTTSSSSYSLSGLDCGSAYNWEVRANCGGGNYSTWASGAYITTDDCCTSPTANVPNGGCTLTCTASGGSGGSYAYKWYSGTSCSGTPISGATSSTYTASASENYACKAYISGYESTCYDCDYGYADCGSNPGEDCSNPITISGTSGSINYTTTGYNDDYFGSCRSNTSEDKVYYLSTAVPNGYTLEFWTTGDNYDVVLYGRRGSCTGTEIACVDDPDGTVLTWVNNTGSSQNVWLFVDGFGGYDGSATLNWDIVSTGIEDVNFIDYLRIFPNPNTGEFIIEMNITKATDLEIKLLNVIGQVIYTEKLNKYVGAYQKSIDVGEYAKGIYNLQLISGEGTVNRKIVVE